MAQQRRIKDRIIVWLVTSSVLITMSWATWITKSMFDQNSNRQLIQQKLEQIEKVEKKMSSVIEKNTEAINALRVELAKMNSNRVE